MKVTGTISKTFVTTKFAATLYNLSSDSVETQEVTTTTLKMPTMSRLMAMVNIPSDYALLKVEVKEQSENVYTISAEEFLAHATKKEENKED